jgi:beta-N-acetylhexosaminidase
MRRTEGSRDGTLERLAAACIFPSFPGLEAPGWVLRRVEEGLGGICLFAYNVGDPEQLAELTASLREARPDVLIGIDEEGGDVTRLEAGRGSSYPGNCALGAVDDEALTEQVAAAIGADLAAVGVNLDFAPVADVNANPANPVIGIRSFGANAELVARHVAVFVTGLQGQGIAACAKHFPGHGDTAQDSHLELPTSDADLNEGLEPFRAAIAAQVQSIMTAHIRVPALDEAPATLSPRVVTGLLRGELGFDGLVIADALEMKAVSATYGVARAAVLAIAAGVDALLVGHDLGEEAVEIVQRALVEGVAAGDLPEARLREAAEQVARVGAWAAAQRPAGDVEREAGRVVARRALEVVGNISLDADPLVVELRPPANIAAGEAEHSLASALAQRFPATQTVVLDEENADPARVFGAQGDRSMIVVVRDAHRHAWMQDLTPRLAPRIVVEVGLPLWRPAGTSAYVATRGGSRVQFEALAELLAETSAVRA